VKTPSPEDGELEALLARDGRLARAWREASREEPPAALDDAVRAVARRAARAGPRARHGPFGGRWRVPLSIAAVLVVSATLTLLVAERREHVPSAGLDAAPAAPPPVEAPPAGPPPAEALPTEEHKLAEPHAPAKDAPPRVNAPSLRKRSAAEPAQPTGESRTELYDAPAEARETIAPAIASEAPAPPAAGDQRMPATVAAPSPTQAEPAGPAGAASSADPHVGEQDTAQGKKDLAPQAFPEREQARADTRAKSSAERDAAETGKRERLETRSAAQRTAEPPLDPKTWVERILALRREGKLQDAERSLQEFRRHYPDYPLPPELARLPTGAPADSR